MKKQIIGSAIVIAALITSAFAFKTEEKIYTYKAPLNNWSKAFNTIDSATKYIGIKSIGFEDALQLKQELQAIKQEMYNQLKPQIEADSNYYKQQQQAPTVAPNKK